MKAVPKTHPAELVEPPLPEARTRRMWDAVDARLHRRSPNRGPWLLASAGAFAVAAALLLMFLGQSTHSMVAQTNIQRAAEVVATDEADRVLRFANGSAVALEPKTRVTMLGNGPEIRLRLERGGVNCTVQQSTKPLVIESAGVVASLGPGVHRVRLAEPRSLSVETLSGSATVQQESRPPVSLEAGDRWTEVGVTRVAGWVSSEPSAPEEPLPLAPKALPKPDPEDAQRIFARGEAARLEGRSAVAAHAFEELYRTFPRDQRAPLAALEAGRLHLRGTGDLSAALAGLSFARATAREPFREDAHAAQVEALERLGRRETCQAAREDFVGTYPSSPHRDKVAARCP